MRILFDSRQTQYKTPFGTLRTGECCVLQIRIPTEVGASGVRLMLEGSEHAVCAELPFSFASRGEDGYELWRLEFTRQETGLHFYWFRIDKRGGGSFRLFRQGSDTNMEAGEKWQLSVIPADFTVPDFAPGAVMYQIFPDRFARSGSCDLTGKLQPFWVHESPDELPEYRPDAHGEVRNNDFFGGNFAGICEKLPYLQELGVGVLYLNPIFMAWSNHRYDTADYRRPDPMLGTEEDFRTLCERACERGIRVLLDGVFNHTGRKSVYFNADGFYPGLGAAQGEQSPYYRWYNFHPFPDEYDAWWGIKNLPAVNELEKSYVDYIIEGENSIIKRWLRAGASGWRLDVADELPDVFIEKIRAAMNEVCPDSYLLGEVWEDGTTKIAYSQRRYLLGRETNGLMNYPFRTALMAFLLGGGAEYFRDSMEQLRENYPAPAFYGAMNFLSTHDTPRLLTILGLSAPAPQTRDERAVLRLNEEELAHGKALLKLASLILYTFPGSPMLYYGDEAGMQGFEDPFNRGTYPWGHEDEELLLCFRQLGALRRAHEALQSGTIVYHAAQGRVLAFSRCAAHDHCLTVVNAGEEVVTLTLPWDAALAEDALSHQAFFCGDGMLRLTLEPYGAMLLTEPQD